ncbi:interferon-induced protein 44-like [Siniperca chuatsi]|uniref:interferon-induced protein 44-like n=1 Tax=Siniperca chuatsi TaxID=119488 RepID=UPI001CE143BD|nr:interferon-induced protein 44-like [Siniperca chuatsi]
MISNSGPYFGEALVLVNGSQAVVYNSPGNYYNFNAAEMHGNDLNLTECEVYQVEETTELERPWRTIIWKSEKRMELMESIKSYKPTVSSVSQVRVLLIGPVGAGKSSFFNSINSVFRGHVTSQAIAGCSTTSLTTQFRTYSLKAGREGKPLPIILCDTMGLEESTGAGLDIDDIGSILKGHLPDRYQFNPSAPLHSEAHSYRKSPALKDKIHCVAYVIDACKVSIMPTKLEEKLDAIRRKVNLIGIPQLVLVTKVDEACPLVTEDVKNIYNSGYIKELMQEVGARLGVPLSCVVPVKNYSEELELDPNSDILLLSAVIQMLRFGDNYFDEISDQFRNIEIKE